MEYRNLDITLISAKGIKNVNLLSKMDVYAVVWIAGGDPLAVIRTPVDKDGDTNPTWNFSTKFAVDDAAAQQNRLTLVIKLRSRRDLGDRDIGEVHVPIKEIIGEDNKVEKLVRYQVRKLDGKPKGELNFSYKFSEKINGEQAKVKSQEEPVTAYPAKHTESGSSSGYQPPPATAYPSAGYSQSGYPPAGYPPQVAPPVAGYGYPPQQAYGGYPPQQAYGGYPPQGYGYPPPQQGYVQQPPRKNKIGGGGMGMGLGAGLLGGALGGMLIGDMISDAGAYDDAGGGFDF